MFAGANQLLTLHEIRLEDITHNVFVSLNNVVYTICSGMESCN